MSIVEILGKIEGFVWGTPFTVTLLAIGLIYMLISKGFVFRYFGHALKNTLGTAMKKEGRKGGEGSKISPFPLLAGDDARYTNTSKFRFCFFRHIQYCILTYRTPPFTKMLLSL